MSSSVHTRSFYLNGEKSFQKYVSEGITHPVFNGYLVYKLRSVRGIANFVFSVSKIVKRLWRRTYDPVIVEDFMTGLVQTSSVLAPGSNPVEWSIAYSGGCLYTFLKYCLYHLICLCNDLHGLSALVGCWSSVFIRRIYNFLNVYPSDNTAFAVGWKVWIL